MHAEKAAMQPTPYHTSDYEYSLVVAFATITLPLASAHSNTLLTAMLRNQRETYRNKPRHDSASAISAWHYTSDNTAMCVCEANRTLEKGETAKPHSQLIERHAICSSPAQRHTSGTKAHCISHRRCECLTLLVKSSTGYTHTTIKETARHQTTHASGMRMSAGKAQKNHVIFIISALAKYTAPIAAYIKTRCIWHRHCGIEGNLPQTNVDALT
jgi:hypothetical protein